MGFFKACGKYIARSVSNHKFHQDQKAARKAAFSETGKAINRAKRKGYRINASALYQKKCSAYLGMVSEKKELREKFISDL